MNRGIKIVRIAFASLFRLSIAVATPSGKTPLKTEFGAMSRSAAYSASKAGQLALGKMLALELAQFRIRVNIICPGSIETGIHDKTQKRDFDEIENHVEFPDGSYPLPRTMAQPEQIARLAVFLSTDAASHSTGTPTWIDGAESLIQG